METLLNGEFKHEAIDVAKDRVGGRGRREVGTGSQSHDLQVLHLLGDSPSASETNPSVFVGTRASQSWPKMG